MRMGNCKRWMAAVAAGVMVSLAVAGSAMAAEAGPGTVQGGSGKAAQQAGRWEMRDNLWYYYDADGNPCTGWIQVAGKDFYLAENGHCLMNTVTPDGFYVSPSGEWFVRSVDILGIDFDGYYKVPSVTEAWAGKDAVKQLDAEIWNTFEVRDIKISDTSMEYVRGEDEEVLIGIYKNTDTGSYRLKLAVDLDKSSTSDKKAATYDYAVFLAFLYQVTSTPEILEDAVYNSWQGDNRWQINRMNYVQVGDSLVKYSAGNGYGYYYIYPMR